MDKLDLENKPTITIKVPDYFSTVPELKLVEQKIRQVLNTGYGPTVQVSQYLLEAGGKKVRPLLTILSGKIFGARTEDLISAASAIELIHMASLIHDDVIDRSSTRRGRPSLNARWGNHLAVLTGDFLFAKAFQLLTSHKMIEVLDQVIEAIDTMCSGEIDQAIDGYYLDQDEERYLNRIYKKTGKLLAVACQAGAQLGEADEVMICSISNYGKYLGYTFQITDDLLDFTGDPKTMGKPKGLDLNQGNLTLPLLKLLQNRGYGSYIRKILQQAPVSSENEQQILQAVYSSDALSYTYSRALQYRDYAKKELGLLAPSTPRTILANLADFVLDRLH